MSYLILECAASYAVALDEEGRFVRVPNLGYEVGQEVDDVVIFDEGQLFVFEARKARRTRGRVGLIAAAACLVVAVIAGGVVWRLPIGTVYMRINPEVSMEVNRFDRVVDVEGENADGEALVSGFSFYGRTIDEVSDDLASRAEEQGYLGDGGTIELTVESDDEEWKTATEDRLVIELEVHLDHRVVVEGSGAPVGGAPDDDDLDDADDWDDDGFDDLDDDEDDGVATVSPETDTAPAPNPPAPQAPQAIDDDEDDDDGWDDDDDGDDDDGWDDDGWDDDDDDGDDDDD